MKAFNDLLSELDSSDDETNNQKNHQTITHRKPSVQDRRTHNRDPLIRERKSQAEVIAERKRKHAQISNRDGSQKRVVEKVRKIEEKDVKQVKKKREVKKRVIERVDVPEGKLTVSQQIEMMRKRRGIAVTDNSVKKVEESGVDGRGVDMNDAVSISENNVVIDTPELSRVVVDFLLRTETVIAVDCEWAGDAFDRTFELCLVQVADTKKHPFLFDTLIGGQALFEEGRLKELLEADNLVKIFHDCRWDSDILFHKHQVKLKNVFDTQIGFAAYKRQTQNMTPIPVGLNTVLRIFAKDKNTFKSEARLGMQTEKDYWKKRPMDDVL
eukprot:TRINITY_DN6444_c0_g1_i2.p1 TRINITY_DN6444_c0_g1~~TRINITY_DN6444_c0_g1_i2.p1  ORF type:complete len:326 (-),score=81.39 TRINITY_DN6444_c0_g1_i2:334-1311(-)